MSGRPGINSTVEMALESSPSTHSDTVNRGPPNENRVSLSSPFGLQSQLRRSDSSRARAAAKARGTSFPNYPPLRPALPCRQHGGNGTRGCDRGRGKRNQTASHRQLTAPTARRRWRSRSRPWTRQGESDDVSLSTRSLNRPCEQNGEIQAGCPD